MFTACFKNNKHEPAQVLLLCHGRKHSYTHLENHFCRYAKDFTTIDIQQRPDIKLDVTQTLPSEHIDKVTRRFDIIASIFCPFNLFFESKREKLNETFFQNIHTMLRPGGLFLTRLNGYWLDLSDETKEAYDIPYSYNLTDVSKFLESPTLLKYFNVKYLYQHELESGNVFDGYISTDKSNRTEFVNKEMLQCIVNKCEEHGIDVKEWNNFNNKQLVVLERKELHVRGARGGSPNLDTHFMIGNRRARIYYGPRGGKYVKVNGKLVLLSKIRS
jgi:SAM-dependent methyltransferase